MKPLWISVLLLMLLAVGTSAPMTGRSAEAGVIAEQPPQQVPYVYGQDLSKYIYDKVAVTRIQSYVAKFTENGTRYISDASEADSGPNMYARNYLVDMFEVLSSGRIETEIVGSHQNIVSRLPGYLPGDNPVFVVSAHYDSAPASPGANCDGSGIAVLLELVDIMSDFVWPLDIYFVAFNSLFGDTQRAGSIEVAQWFMNNEIDLLTLYNVDTVLVPDTSLPSDWRIQMAWSTYAQYHESHYWADLGRVISNNIGLNLIRPIADPAFIIWDTSDHYSFHERMMRSVTCFFESGLALDGAYQNRADRWNNYRYDYFMASEVAGVVGASMAFTMAREHGEVNWFSREFVVEHGQSMTTYVPITAATEIEVSCRWYGGTTAFYIVDPNYNVIASREFDDTSPWEETFVFSVDAFEIGIHRIIAYNTHSGPVGYELHWSFDSDIDSNGVMDSQEYWLDEELWTSDQDGDSVSDADEIVRGMDVNSPDSDSDSMPDAYELSNGFNPTDPTDANADADADGVTNSQEYLGGLNPFSEDSDSDGMSDLWELENGLDPLVNDAEEDPDGDSYSNLEEFLMGTNPLVAESEGIPAIWLIVTPVGLIAVAALVYLRVRERDY